MSSVADLEKRMNPSMASKVLKVANTAYFGACNFINITFIAHAIEIVGLQEAKENQEHAVIVSRKYVCKKD
jgi:HD-like signal output (HDOD) protein